MALISWRDCRRKAWLCVLPILLVWSNAAGQGLTTGVLHGTVEDATGAPLSDVLVTLRDSGSGLTRSQSTDRSGQFRFGQLAAGDYEIVAELGGFQPVRMTDIPVRPGRQVAAAVILPAASGVVTEQKVIAYVTRLK